MIPKRIFYAWYGSATLPFEAKRNIKKWRELNPNYEIIELNETNTDVSDNSFVRDAYLEGRWGFVPDFPRLAAIYEYGGFYMDVDVELLKPLDQLTNEKSVWGMENSGKVNAGTLFGAEKGNPDILNLMEIYRGLSFSTEEMQTIVSTDIISKYLATKGLRQINKTQLLDSGAKIYSVEYFAPLHFWGGGKVTKNSIAVHYYDGSWVSGNKQKSLYSWLVREWILWSPWTYYTVRAFFGKK